MKKLITCLVCLACASCAPGPKAFIQGDIRIVPPVIQEGYDKDTGEYTIMHFNDGGTLWIKATDAEGKKFDIYLDHRISSPSPGKVYLKAHPGGSNTVFVVDQTGFREKILNGMKY
jgi:hypothetical protein